MKEVGYFRDIKFEVKKNDKDIITGFSLLGLGDTNAESYCLSFLTAQANGNADIIFEDGFIVFQHGGVSSQEANQNYFVWGTSEGGEFRTEITADDQKSLKDLLNLRGYYKDKQIRVTPELAWSKGFTLYIK